MGDGSEADEGGGKEGEEDGPSVEGEFIFGDGFVGHGFPFLFMRWNFFGAIRGFGERAKNLHHPLRICLRRRGRR
jgi:hypothetical protein